VPLGRPQSAPPRQAGWQRVGGAPPRDMAMAHVTEGVAGYDGKLHSIASRAAGGSHGRPVDPEDDLAGATGYGW
jgi:hypothetical protein